MAQLPNNATIDDIIAALQDVTGISNRVELAELIGSTAVTTDDVPVLISKLSTVRQQLVDITNELDLNADPIRIDVITELKKLNPALTITNSSKWPEIIDAIALVLVGDAAVADVLIGKKFMNASGEKTGTMVNNGAVTITPGAAAQIIPVGYHNGSGTVAAVAVPANKVLNDTSIAGTQGTMQKRVPTSGAYISALSAKADSSGNLALEPPTGYYEQGLNTGGYGSLLVSDPDFIAANFRADKNVFGLQGSIPVNLQASRPATTDAKIWDGGLLHTYVPPGVYENDVYVAITDPELIAANILSTANIFGLQGSAVAGKRVASGWSTGGSSTNGITITGLGFTPTRVFLRYDGKGTNANTWWRVYYCDTLTPMHTMVGTNGYDRSTTDYNGTQQIITSADGFSINNLTGLSPSLSSFNYYWTAVE